MIWCKKCSLSTRKKVVHKTYYGMNPNLEIAYHILYKKWKTGYPWKNDKIIDDVDFVLYTFCLFQFFYK